jgi:hypothetical protein
MQKDENKKEKEGEAEKKAPPPKTPSNKQFPPFPGARGSFVGGPCSGPYDNDP